MCVCKRLRWSVCSMFTFFFLFSSSRFFPLLCLLPLFSNTFCFFSLSPSLPSLLYVQFSLTHMSLAKSSRVMPFIRFLNTNWTSVSFLLSWYTPLYLYLYIWAHTHAHIHMYVYIEDVDDDDDAMMWLMDWTERRCELKKGYVVGVSRR